MSFNPGQLVRVKRGTKNCDLLKAGTVARVAVSVPSYGARDHKGDIPKAGVILDNGQYPYVWNESRFEAFTPPEVSYATPSVGSPFNNAAPVEDDVCESSLS